MLRRIFRARFRLMVLGVFSLVLAVGCGRAPEHVGRVSDTVTLSPSRRPGLTTVRSGLLGDPPNRSRLMRGLTRN